MVDDRFVSPLEDLTHQYQSYELEETTRVLSVQTKKHEQVNLPFYLPFAFDSALPRESNPFPNERELLFSSFFLNFFLLSLPPPTLV